MKKKMEVYKEDTVIMREGEINTEMYKLVSGNVALYFRYGEANEYLLGILPQKRFFGEIGFLTKTPSPYTVVTVNEACLMRVSEDEFEEFIRNNARNAIELMQNMAQNILTLNKHIDLIVKELEDNIKKEENKGELIDIRERLLQYKTSGIAGLENFSLQL